VYVEFPTFSVAEAVKALEITDTGFFAFKNKASGEGSVTLLLPFNFALK
jgi:hypothetical protein